MKKEKDSIFILNILTVVLVCLFLFMCSTIDLEESIEKMERITINNNVDFYTLKIKEYKEKVGEKRLKNKEDIYFLVESGILEAKGVRNESYKPRLYDDNNSGYLDTGDILLLTKDEPLEKYQTQIVLLKDCEESTLKEIEKPTGRLANELSFYTKHDSGAVGCYYEKEKKGFMFIKL